ncbi:hypothetical protein [Moorena producens]|uniref:hypothetical protein n=1 Tax=Moorena producens TaxID=1155739 RepID=UPI001314C619|nr:hypothetical protein [Moorena producens]
MALEWRVWEVWGVWADGDIFIKGNDMEMISKSFENIDRFYKLLALLILGMILPP